MTQTFWLEPTDGVALGLRRYTHGDGGFDCAHGYHSAITYTGRGTVTLDDQGNEPAPQPVDHADPRWPTTCADCGTPFPENAAWQEWSVRLYRRTDTGELRTLHPAGGGEIAPAAEPGATWNASWIPDNWKHEDGLYLMVRCPDGHDWAVDSRASNCGLPDDNVHHCWIRHGDPRECRVTVDKNGVTCNAGAGSIQTPNWHGFLRDGQLVA